MEEDRTELNDLSSQQADRVASMSKEWFHIAKDVERLKGKSLAPVGNDIKKLGFRKDTSSGTTKK